MATTYLRWQTGNAGESNKRVMQNEASEFNALLRACAKSRNLAPGRRLHGEIKERGLVDHCADDLVLMYAKCGALATAQNMLHSLKCRDVSAWNSLIAGYAQCGQGHKSLHCFECMQSVGISPDYMTFACILKACGAVKAIEKGEQIHDEIARQGLLEKEIVLGNALVDMYAKCGSLTKAQRVLEELPRRTVVTWNALIGGYAQHGQGQQGLKCFERMKHEGFCPNPVTFICILKACASIHAIDEGKKIHDQIARRGLLQHDVVLGTAVVDMYAKCGALEKARKVLEELPFRDVITWSALIAGYAHQGQGEQALKCFEKMRREGLSPNAFTFACLIQACGSIRALHKGEKIHNEVSKQGLLRNDIVLGTALVDMYAKCGALQKARRVLEELPSRDVVTWSALITGYAQHGQGEQALRCFEEMQKEGLTPNAVTFTCILKACGSIGADDKGEQIHDTIAQQGLLLENNIVLYTALVDMYAKSGAFLKAEQVLKELHCCNVVPWNALLTGYTQRGENEQALSCFEEMQCKGISPNEVTFSCVLNACSRLGLVEKGHMFFLNMRSLYGVVPVLEHFVCMVDLFGRAGHLDKAVEVIQEMPTSDYMAVWSALLGACQKWGDVAVGKWAYEQAVSLDKGDGAAYVLMGNIYAAAGMHKDARNVEAMRKENRAWKCPGYCWWIDMSKSSHSLVYGVKRHPMSKPTCGRLGYFSCDMSHKAFSLCGHQASPNFCKRSKYNLLYSQSFKVNALYKERLVVLQTLLIC